MVLSGLSVVVVFESHMKHTKQSVQVCHEIKVFPN